MDLVDLLKLQEGKTLEFKRDLSTPEGALRTIVAFANTAGGTVLVGVEDKSRRIRGVGNPLDLEERLADPSSDLITPRLVPEIEILTWRRTQVLAVQVYPSPNRPHYLNREGPESGVYVRVGSTNRRADREFINELRDPLAVRPTTNSRCRIPTRKPWTSEPLPSHSRPCAWSLHGAGARPLGATPSRNGPLLARVPITWIPVTANARALARSTPKGYDHPFPFLGPPEEAIGMMFLAPERDSESAPKHTPRSRFALACLLTLLHAGSAGATSYTLTVLGTLRSDTTGVSEATGINNAGLVVGWAETDAAEYHVLRWTRSDGMTDAGSLVPPFLSAATDVNGSGELCGFGLTQSTGFATAVHQLPDGDLLGLPKPPGAGDSYGYGISDAGVIVGWTNLNSGCGYPSCPGNPGHAIQWNDGARSFLPDLGGSFSVAADISADGSMICGYGANTSGQIRGFRLHGTEIDELAPLAGYSESYAEGINDAGDVVGYSHSGSRDEATLWVGATASDLGVPGDALGSIALRINSSGGIVGYSLLGGSETRAALFSGSGPPEDLNTLIPPGSGYTLTYAYGINDVGQIVGDALGATFSRGMVLTPDNEAAAEPSPSRKRGLELIAPWPNPVSTGAMLRYRLPDAGLTRVVVVDIAGREVARLLDQTQAAGEHSCAWDGRDSQGRMLNSGVYLMRIEAGGASRSQKIVVSR
jgi:probable HAF family extracellular repeat protein